MTPRIAIPTVTPEFVAQLRETNRTAADSLGKLILDKFIAHGDKDNKTPGENRGDKLVLSFLKRLQNAVTNNKPGRTVLLGHEKWLLDQACREYAASEIKRLEAKEEHGSLEPF